MINLKSIARNRDLKPPRILLYSPHGFGKTTFGASAPSPIFILTEDGLGLLEADHFPLAQSYGDVIDAIGALYQEEHVFKTVVVDSLDWLDNLIWQDVNAKHDAKDLAYGKGAVIASDYWRKVLDGLNALRNDGGMTVVLLAHCQIKRFDSPEVEPYDRYQPKLQERSSALLQEWCDAVLFGNYQIVIAKDDVGFSQKHARGVSTGKRLLYTTERPAFYAKNRYSLPDSLPLSWAALESAVLDGINPAAKAA